MVSFYTLKLLEKKHIRNVLAYLAHNTVINKPYSFSDLKVALDINQFLLDRTLKELIANDLITKITSPRPKYAITSAGRDLLSYDLERDDIVKRSEGPISFYVGKWTEVNVEDGTSTEAISLLEKNKALENHVLSLSDRIMGLKARIRGQLRDNETMKETILGYIDEYLLKQEI